MVQYEARNTPDDDKDVGHLPYQLAADGIVIAEFASPDDMTAFMQQKQTVPAP